MQAKQIHFKRISHIIPKFPINCLSFRNIFKTKMMPLRHKPSTAGWTTRTEAHRVGAKSTHRVNARG